jgi:dipeptidyl aminopeptidase/acylaminoacyl peptidase
LLMHGSGDTRVDALQSMRFVQKLYEYKHPVRFILFEGADHTISQYESEAFSQVKQHFDKYVRDRKALPKL